MRYSLLIEYDGSDYSGWQIQKAQKTVQGEIEKALEIILKAKPVLSEPEGQIPEYMQRGRLHIMIQTLI